LYKKLLHKSGFGQAHCAELLIRVHTKFTLNFLDIPISFSQISKFEIISGIYLNKNKKRKRLNRTWAESGPWLRPFGKAARSPLRPHARGRGPTAARPGRLCGPPCARGCDGARSPWSETARWRRRPQLMCCGVEGEGTKAVGGVCQARGEVALLTEEVGRQWGGGEQPTQQRSDGRGRLSRAGKTPVSTCRLVRGRGR
jgi:hypothetical protein